MARILIVDDIAVYRQKLKSIFENEGHEVVGQAANGLQAVMKYKELQPDLVTMDLLMDGVDGFDGIGRIRANDPEAKILVVSSVREKEKVMMALEKGAYAYIIKPFEHSKVASVLENMGFSVDKEKRDDLLKEMEVLKTKKKHIQSEFKHLSRG